MTAPRLKSCLAAAVLCGGCTFDALRPKRPAAAPAEATRWAPARVTHTRVAVEPLGDVANNGLQLPAVSPDGQWVACLRRDDGEASDLDAVFGGEGCQAMSLHLRATTPGAPARRLCAAGAAWPAWSADGKCLAYLARTRPGQWDLCILDVPAGRSRRIAMAFARILMPAPSPAGTYVAVVAAAAKDAPPRLHVLAAADGAVRPCPADDPADRHFWPQWTADGDVVYVLGRGEQAWLARWTPGRNESRRLAEVHMPPSAMATYQALAGLGAPLSPDGRRFAYYHTAADRIVLVDLDGGKTTQLPAGTRAGCWVGPNRFAAATDAEMMLIADGAPSCRLMRGPWLPRAADAAAAQLIACTRSSQPRALSLVRLKLIAAD